MIIILLVKLTRSRVDEGHVISRNAQCTVNPGGGRWGRSLLISAPNLDPLLRLGQVSSKSLRGLLGGMLAYIQQIVVGSSILSNLF